MHKTSAHYWQKSAELECAKPDLLKSAMDLIYYLHFCLMNLFSEAFYMYIGMTGLLYIFKKKLCKCQSCWGGGKLNVIWFDVTNALHCGLWSGLKCTYSMK